MKPYTAPLIASALLGLVAVQAVAEQQPAVVGDSAAAAPAERLAIPFGVGERLQYDVKFGSIKAGSGTVEVVGIEAVRGRPAYHARFEVKGGIPFFRVHSVFDSWMDTTSLSSLRFVQDQDEGPRERERRYEIYPDRQIYKELVAGEGEEQASVANPLDDASFLYFIRTVPLQVGQTYTFTATNAGKLEHVRSATAAVLAKKARCYKEP